MRLTLPPALGFLGDEIRQVGPGFRGQSIVTEHHRDGPNILRIRELFEYRNEVGVPAIIGEKREREGGTVAQPARMTDRPTGSRQPTDIFSN